MFRLFGLMKEFQAFSKCSSNINATGHRNQKRVKVEVRNFILSQLDSSPKSETNFLAYYNNSGFRRFPFKKGSSCIQVVW